MPISFPGESKEYRSARNQLLQREIELRRTIEAAARREFPPGGIAPQDYVFEAFGERRSQIYETFAIVCARKELSRNLQSHVFAEDETSLPNVHVFPGFTRWSGTTHQSGCKSGSCGEIAY